MWEDATPPDSTAASAGAVCAAMTYLDTCMHPNHHSVQRMDIPCYPSRNEKKRRLLNTS